LANSQNKRKYNSASNDLLALFLRPPGIVTKIRWHSGLGCDEERDVRGFSMIYRNKVCQNTTMSN
jgi:hypothetical protein